MGAQITGSRLRAQLTLCLLVAALATMAALAPVASAEPNNAIDGINHGLQDTAHALSRTLAKQLGFRLTRLHLEVGWARSRSDVPNALTGTNESLNGDIDKDGPVCQIAVDKPWFEAIKSDDERDEVLAHEIFHCYEYEVTPAAHSDNEWIMEGLARWADLTLYPHTRFALALKALSQYYATPQVSLFARSEGSGKGYDAVGFWAHLQDTTGDLWHRVRAVVLAGVGGHDQAALSAALPAADETEFLDSWGSSAFDLPAGTTPDWRMKSPLAGRYYPSTHQPTDVDSSSTFTLAPWSTAQLRIGAGAAGPLIEIHLDQSVHARFGVSQNYVGSDITTRIFCSDSNISECQCPPGDTGSVPNLTPLPDEPDLGAASDATGGSLTVTYLSPSNSGYCEPEKPKPVMSTLLGNRSCQGLLPGYDTALEGEFKTLLAHYTGEAPPTETETDGNYNSLCFFAGYKGSIEQLPEPGFQPQNPGELPPDEPVFVGSIATGTFTERTTSIAVAEQDFKIRADGVNGPSAGVGEESELSSTPEETNKYGLKECGSLGVVRVKNEIAGFTIAGLAEDDCGAAARQLLAEVASEL